MAAIVAAGSGGIAMGAPGCSFFQRGENILTYATRSARFCFVSATHGGMFVLTRPRVMVLKTSWSVGKLPVGVERHLNTAVVKSRGFGSIQEPFSPSPSPCAPWQPTQYLA